MSHSPRKPLVLKYGTGNLSLPPNLPASYALLTPHFPQPLMNPKEYIDSLLNAPTACRPFNDFFTTGDTVVIVISESTRLTLSEMYLLVYLWGPVFYPQSSDPNYFVLRKDSICAIMFPPSHGAFYSHTLTLPL